MSALVTIDFDVTAENSVGHAARIGADFALIGICKRKVNCKGAPMQATSLQDGLSAADFDRMADNAREATDFLKALAHEGRLMILCHLVSGEKTVTELEELLSSRQAAVSQQLARLRLEGLVEFRRDGKAIYYQIADIRVQRMIETVHEMFCQPDADAG